MIYSRAFHLLACLFLYSEQQTAKNCLKKVTIAVKTNGDLDNSLNISQLDGAAGRVKAISPLVDDFVSILYPPLCHTEAVQRVRLPI